MPELFQTSAHHTISGALQRRLICTFSPAIPLPSVESTEPSHTSELPNIVVSVWLYLFHSATIIYAKILNIISRPLNLADPVAWQPPTRDIFILREFFRIVYTIPSLCYDLIDLPKCLVKFNIAY